jgi:valyl-tRNA synthetase
MMLKAQNLTIDPAFAPVQAMPSSLGKLGTIYMGLGADVDAKAEIAKMQKQIEQLDGALRGIAAKLGNPNFMQRAKPEVIEAEKARNAEYTEKRDKLTKIIASLGG